MRRSRTLLAGRTGTAFSLCVLLVRRTANQTPLLGAHLCVSQQRKLPSFTLQGFAEFVAGTTCRPSLPGLAQPREQLLWKHLHLNGRLPPAWSVHQRLNGTTSARP